MKKLIIILFLTVNIFAFAQKCNYQTAVNTENLNQTGKFKLLIKNNNDKSLRIPKEKCGDSNILVTDWIYKN